MNNNQNIWCDPLKVLRVLIGVFFALGLLVYVWLQATSGFDSDIETETALAVEINKTASARAYVFRDETVLGKNNNGAIVTVVSEGDRVSKGQLLANIYPNSEDTLLQDEINRIDRKIAILDESTVDSQYVVTDLGAIDGEITEVFADVYASGSAGNLSDAIDGSAELLAMLNRRNLIVSSTTDFTKEKEMLLERRRELEAKIDAGSESVYANTSGYFYSNVDGYEEIFTPDKIENLTLKSFYELTSQQPEENVSEKGSVKVINDFVWNLVCEVSSEKAAFLSVNNTYTVVFPESGDDEIKMKLVNIISETTSPKALAVFRVNVMPSTFNFKRGQSAEIVLDVTEGLSVPKKAIRQIDGENGVYILVGDVIHFRRVHIIDEMDNYYLVSYGKNAEAFEQDSENQDGKEKSKMLSLYDNVIVSGKELFDGKIVG